jgi:hypothetical protein
MKKYLWIALALVALIGLFACNKQKPVKLDYKEAGTEKLFEQKGLPGEGYVGTPPEDYKHKDYEPSSGKKAKQEEVKKEEKKEEKKPDAKDAEEKK